MEVEHDNLRAALEWTATADPDLCLQLAVAWAPFWRARGYFSEGRRWLARALANSRDGTLERARGLHRASGLAFLQGDYAAAHRLALEGIEVAQALGDLRTLAHLQNDVGIAGLRNGDLVASKAWFEKSLAVFEQAGDQRGVAIAQANLGECAAQVGDYATARRVVERSLAIVREFGDRRLETIAHLVLGKLDLHSGDLASAATHFREALTIARQRADPRWIAESLAWFSHLAAAETQPERSLRLAGAAEACRGSIGVQDTRTLGGLWMATAERLAVGRMQKLLGEQLAAAVWAEGRAMSWPEAVEYALRPCPPGGTGQ